MIESRIPVPLRDRQSWPWDTITKASLELDHSKEWPRISIVMPSYNQSNYIEQAIRSVLLQDYPSLEFLVIDGGSNDGAADVIRHYEDCLTHFVSEPDNGQSHAINKGFRLATGEIISWLCSDDYLLPGALRSIAELYLESPHSVAWIGACELHHVGQQNVIVQQPKLTDDGGIGDWGNTSQFWQPSAFINREAFDSAGGFVDETLHYVMDVDLWLRLSKVGKFAITNQCLSATNLYPEIKTLASPASREAEFSIVYQRHGLAEIVEARIREGLGADLERVLSRVNGRTLLKHLARRVVRRVPG